ncbi:MAG: serine/threonine protein kinase [Rubripirellula sp.]
MSSPPFEFLGPYRIGKPLGRGGMGTVFAAVHEKTKQHVAVKLISDNVADESKFRRRFDAEIKSLQCLSHDGIVRIYGFGEEEGHLFYSMELVRGDSLQKVIKREKRLEWQTTIDVAIQICGALKHAHDIGVIHRDLKPANLVVDENWQVKLVDFGIAKIFGDSNTVAGSLLGTADYMAPEQATSEGITQRTDLYALGSVMYAMLAGRAPFTGKSVTQVINALQRDRPVPIDLIRPDVPPELVELIHELLEKSPEDRPPTALAVMNRLKAMKAGLERIQTVASEGSPTEEGLGEDGETGVFAAPQRESDRDGTGIEVRAGTGIGGTPTSGSEIQSAGSDDMIIVSPEEPTVMSVGNVGPTRLIEGMADDDEEPTSNTHFQTVKDAQSESDVFANRHPWTDQNLVGLGKIIAMAAVLVFGCILFFWAMQTPSPDELYLDALSGNTTAMQAFLQLYPNDRRYIEVEDLQMGTKLRGMLKRLNAQEKLGITDLSPSEESFVSVMEGRELNPIQAAGKIEKWLNVYDSEANSDASNLELGDMIAMAKREQQRLLERAPLNAIDKRAGNLLSRVRRALESDDPVQVKKELNAIIDMFKESEWAGPAVDEATRQLKEIEALQVEKDAMGAESTTPSEGIVLPNANP